MTRGSTISQDAGEQQESISLMRGIHILSGCVSLLRNMVWDICGGMDGMPGFTLRPALKGPSKALKNLIRPLGSTQSP